MMRTVRKEKNTKGTINLKTTLQRWVAVIIGISAIYMNASFISGEVVNIQPLLLLIQVVCLVGSFIANLEIIADAAIGGALVATFISPINKWLTAKASALEGIQAGVIPVFALIGIVGSIFLWVFIIFKSNKTVYTKCASLFTGISIVALGIVSGVLINLLIPGKAIGFGGNLSILVGIIGFSVGAFAVTKSIQARYLLGISIAMIVYRIADSLIIERVIKKGIGSPVAVKSLLPCFLVGITVLLYSNAIRPEKSLRVEEEFFDEPDMK